MGFLLAIISYVLLFIVSVINFPVVLFKHARSKGFFIVTDRYWREHAVAVDIFGNYAFRSTWNMLFKTEAGYLFGERDETISSALGKNQRDNTLTITGTGMCWFLDFIDENHCYNSIKE